MKRYEKYKSWIISFVFVVAVLAVYKTFDNFDKVKEFLKVILSSLTPFIVGFIIAYILNIPCSKIEEFCKKSKVKLISKLSKAISIISVYFVLVISIYIAIRAVAPAIYKNIEDLSVNITVYAMELIEMISKFQAEYDISFFQFDAQGIMKAFENIVAKFDLAELSKYAQGVIDVTAGVLKVFVGIIVSVYMLVEKDKIKNSIKRVLHIFLREQKTANVIVTLNKINNIFSKYMFCLLLDAVIMMFLSSVALHLMGVKYATILGITIGLFNLIPYFGAITACVITVLITLLTGTPTQAFWVAIVLLIIQQIDGNFIAPKIMGEMLDASPLLIILAVTLGGGLFGVIGMIISVPFFITIKMAITQFLDAKEAMMANSIQIPIIDESEEEENSEE